MDLKQFYKNKNILITGCTGNIGKALVGKILKSFPEIGTVYLLIRDKGGRSATQRIKEYFDDEALIHLTKLKRNFKENIVWLEGDITKINLGLTEESIQLIRRHINIIFHSAANVQLKEKMKNLIIINIKGTQELLNLAETCLNLDCFIYISTAYTNARKSVKYIEEIYYKHPFTPQELLDLAKYKSIDQLQEENTRLLNNDWLLPYTYTKNASENLVKQYESKFKIGIFRPGVVVESLYEPFPYSGKNISVLSLIILMASKGYTMKSIPGIQVNCVPIDFTINAIIATTHDIFTKKSGTSHIYNYSSNNNPISFNKSIKYYLDGFKNPEIFSKLPKDKIVQHIINLKTFFENTRSETRLEKHDDLSKLLIYFTHHPKYFEYHKVEKVWENLSDDDKKEFYFNINTVDWKSFFTNMYINRIFKETKTNKPVQQDLLLHTNKL